MAHTSASSAEKYFSGLYEARVLPSRQILRGGLLDEFELLIVHVAAAHAGRLACAKLSLLALPPLARPSTESDQRSGKQHDGRQLLMQGYPFPDRWPAFGY